MPKIARRAKVEHVLAALDHKIDQNAPRSFATIVDALVAFVPEARHEGLSAWIISEKRVYRFIGGITDADFVLDPASQMTWDRS